MAVKFLSPEWADAVQAALDQHEGFRTAIGETEVTIQFKITGGAEGDVDYHLVTSGGKAKLQLGLAETPDVVISQSFETATRIFQGDLNIQGAFYGGKVKISGNFAKLLLNQNAISQMTAAVKEIDVEF